MEDIHRITQIRDNLVSIYMIVSEILVLFLMGTSAFFACIFIPFNMNEYSLPIYFRDSNSNVFLDFLKMRILAFLYFIILSGCLPHFNFYRLTAENKCLYSSSTNFGIN